MPEHSPITSATTLGRYRLVERIGAGGMGEVWKAHDANLDRTVAIKVLLHGTLHDTTSRERFRREAMVLSKISHPGVATVFDFDAQDGHDFLVMEYVTGGTLDRRLTEGPLAVEELLQVGAALADAIADAHERGVLHRDLKPGNVVLTAAGAPKILDFGLAVLLSAGQATGRMTQTGTIVGSIPYMSPEQLFGDADDARTDLYALGVILFEMATGRRPFEKERPEALMFAIINSAPPSPRGLRPDLPVAFDRLVTDCLQKDPADRPASASVIASTLREIGRGSPGGEGALPTRDTIRAIAVLPFRNLSRDPTQEYFADGMTEAVTSDLARIKALKVISCTSAMKYKGTELSLPEIARELNVDAVLEGSALLIGERVRLNVQLISARSDETLWADRYDRDLVDVLGLQSEMAETVAREIAIQLTPQEATQLAQRNPVDPAAHIEFLKCRHAQMGGTKDAMEVAVRHGRRALELDPSYANAWSALADCYLLQAVRGMAPPGEVIPEAIAAATRALELDETLADAHTSIGTIQIHSGEFAAGMDSLERAVELNPGLAMAQDRYALGLTAFGRFEEALAAGAKAVRLDPLSGLIRTIVGDVHYFAREYAKAELHYRMAIELDPRFDGAHTDLARTLEAQGRFDEARAAYEEGRKFAGGVAGPSFGLAHLEAAAGNEAEARRMLEALKSQRESKVISSWGVAALHASLGDVDEAFAWFEIAIAEHSPGLTRFRVHPRLDPIRDDPRYWPMVERLGLA